MSNITEPMISGELEKVILQGDLADLNEAQRIEYTNAVCSSLKLNPITKPFAYINMKGTLVMYATRNCTDQLRKIWNVSVKITDRKMKDGILMITAQASLPNGRVDESMGVLSLGNLKGEALANAIMKCETKAKRRVTLSICGLSIADESEIDTMRDISMKNINEFNQMSDMNTLLKEKEDEEDEEKVVRTTVTPQPKEKEQAVNAANKALNKDKITRQNLAPVSQDQIKRLFTIIGKSDATEDQARVAMEHYFGCDSTKKLNQTQYDALCEMIQTKTGDEIMKDVMGADA